MKEKKIEYQYREYTKDPLSESEIRAVLTKLGLSAGQALRKKDTANKVLRLKGDEPEKELIRYMAEHPTLLQRPIGVSGKKAVIGRPPERLLELVSQ
ncbi:MAG: arsenate reductase (glutaredoxin) [Gemmatimonadetes bacterium]|nr:arsenate reductase (glutaredoxin) [Gemmatimonadota bacterium]